MSAAFLLGQLPFSPSLKHLEVPCSARNDKAEYTKYMILRAHVALCTLDARSRPNRSPTLQPALNRYPLQRYILVSMYLQLTIGYTDFGAFPQNLIFFARLDFSSGTRSKILFAVGQTLKI
jgi:hypothetical protein